MAAAKLPEVVLAAPLMLAAASGNPQAVTILVENGADELGVELPARLGGDQPHAPPARAVRPHPRLVGPVPRGIAPHLLVVPRRPGVLVLALVHGLESKDAWRESSASNDRQMLEGALTASRFVGFHLIDAGLKQVSARLELSGEPAVVRWPGRDAVEVEVLGVDERRVTPRPRQETIVEELAMPTPAISREMLMVGLRMMVHRAFSRKELKGKQVRQVTLRAMLENRRSWERPMVLKEPCGQNALITALANSGVLVNESRATIDGAGNFRAIVPLTAGQNTLTARLTTVDETVLTATVSVTATGLASPFAVIADPTSGLAPLTPTFRVVNTTTGDFTNEGIVDASAVTRGSRTHRSGPGGWSL